MAWNEPGGNNRDPWGNRNKNDQGPPDLDEVLGKLSAKIRGVFGGGKGGDGNGSGSKGGNGPVLILVLALLGGWLVYDSAYIIEPAYKGVVLRFGKYQDTINAGFHFRLPLIETVHRVNARQVQKIDYSEQMLTQDENIVKVGLGVQYRVGNNPQDAYAYLFNTQNADRVLQESARSAIREVIGKSKMDFILKEGRAEVAEETKTLLQRLLDSYGTGLLVQSVNLLDAQPPDPVQDAFDDAIKAREDKQRKINEAEEYANLVIPGARGEAARMGQEAAAYKAALVAKAEGEAQRFESLLTEYQKAPAVTRERLYLETTEKALSSVSKIIVDGENSNSLMYLPIDKMVESAQQPAPAQSGSPASSVTSSRDSSGSAATTGSRSDSRTRNDRRSRGDR